MSHQSPDPVYSENLDDTLLGACIEFLCVVPFIALALFALVSQ